MSPASRAMTACLLMRAFTDPVDADARKLLRDAKAEADRAFDALRKTRKASLAQTEALAAKAVRVRDAVRAACATDADRCASLICSIDQLLADAPARFVNFDKALRRLASAPGYVPVATHAIVAGTALRGVLS